MTVLFADVVGSTALGESIDPEDLRALLARYYAIARDVVAAHGGTLEKFIGDAVMAVFGLPVAHDDDAGRAVSAALEMRDRVRDDAQLGERLPIRLGLQSGEVVAARDHTAADSLVTGDAVNVAARLQQAAEPWAILVGERTARAAHGFEFESPRSIDAKGKAAPVACRRLIGHGQESRPRVPLVGRQGDLAQLELTAKRSFGERRPFLVSILAAPGVGKSRLLEEFIARLPGLDDTASVAIAQCLPYGQRLTYWPLSAIAHSILGLADDAPPEEIRATASRWLAERREPNAERIAGVLAATIGGGEVEGIDRAALTDAWRALVERAADRSPLVLVIEDLHWSSDSLLDLIEAMLQQRGEARVLMIVLARPELLDRRPTWGGGRRNYVALSLEPLDDPDVATLVEHLLDGPSPEIVRLVVDRAEGNPFYAGEIVRSIVDQTPDLRDAVAVAAAVRALPDTVQATILARIDILQPTVRRAIQLGSVFGRSFRVEAITTLDPDGPDLAAAVDELIDRDLLRPSTGGVTFRHILIREVAYSTLPRAERARLHAAAGDWLAAHSTGREEEVAELVAVHYREAATLAGVSGTLTADLAARAVQWLGVAASAASAGAASLEAAGHLRSAIELATPAERPWLYEQLGDVLVGGDRSIEAYARALELADAGGASATDRVRLIASELMVFSRWAGSVAGLSIERVELLRRLGVELLPAVTDLRVRARFLAALAFVPAMIPGTEEIEPRSDVAATEALEIARQLDDANLISAALDGLGAIALLDDDLAAMAEHAAERLSISNRLDAAERGDAALVRAWGLLSLGRLGEALAASAPIHTWFGPGQAITFQFSARAWEVSILHAMGRWDEAVARARRMVELWDEADRGPHGYAVHGFVRTVLIGRARRDSGLEDAFMAMSREVLDPFESDRRITRLESILRGDLAAIAGQFVVDWREWHGRTDYLDIALGVLADHRHAADGDALRGLIGYAEARGLRLPEAQARRLLGLVESDLTQLRHARSLFEAMGADSYLARTDTEIGLLAGDEAAFDRGVLVLEALGDAEQLDRISARRADRVDLRS